MDAFAGGEQAVLAKVVKKPTITYLDNEVAKLAKSLNVADGDGAGSSLA